MLQTHRQARMHVSSPSSAFSMYDIDWFGAGPVQGTVNIYGKATEQASRTVSATAMSCFFHRKSRFFKIEQRGKAIKVGCH